MKKLISVVFFLSLILLGCENSTEEPKEFVTIDPIIDRTLYASYEIHYSKEATTWIVGFKDAYKTAIPTSENELHLRNYMSIIGDLKISVFWIIYSTIVTLLLLGFIIYHLRKKTFFKGKNPITNFTTGTSLFLICMIFHLIKAKSYLSELHQLFLII